MDIQYVSNSFLKEIAEFTMSIHDLPEIRGRVSRMNIIRENIRSLASIVFPYSGGIPVLQGMEAVSAFMNSWVQRMYKWFRNGHDESQLPPP